jgi:hypothetical protein
METRMCYVNRLTDKQEVFDHLFKAKKNRLHINLKPVVLGTTI